MGNIYIKKMNIVTAETDAVVNAANEYLKAGSGVCGALFKAAGHENLQKACDDLGRCHTGSAVITLAFDLKAKYIIHAVGPRWSGGGNGEEMLLYSAYISALDTARKSGCKSIAFPLISAGIFGYPLEEAWQIAIVACADFLEGSEADMDITFAVLDDNILNTGLGYLNMMEK